MAEVPTTKQIDLLLLTAEVGVGLSMSQQDDVRTITGDVDQAVLEAAVEAHAAPAESPDRIEALEAEVQGIKDRAAAEAAKAAPTAKGVALAVAAEG